jgi:hypothetical protein
MSTLSHARTSLPLTLSRCSGCDEEKSTYASLQLITQWGVKAILGPSCPSITRTIAKSAFFYDVPVIGYAIPRCTHTRAPLTALLSRVCMQLHS